MEGNGYALNTEPLANQVYKIIRDKIINFKLKPGEKIDLNKLQNELNISKTPLRVAIVRLEMEQFVEVKPRAGTFVAVPNMKDMLDILDLRKAIEWQAVQLAVNKVPVDVLLSLKEKVSLAEKLIEEGIYHEFMESDIKLHQTIFNCAGNPQLINVKNAIDNKIKWLRYIGATTPKRMRVSCLRHHQIIDAILKGDRIAARDLMELHIDEIKSGLLEDFD